jgi:hypothetical protein
VFAQIPFRTFAKPLGFNVAPQLTLDSFNTFVKYLPSFIELSESEDNLPIRNLREFVQNVSFGGSVIGTQDRRRLRAILASFFLPALFSDSFKFLEPDSQESDIWKFPGEGSNLSFLKTIPFFPLFDTLMVNHSMNEVLRDWNFSVWLSKPFLSILETSPTGLIEDQRVAKISDEEVEVGKSQYMEYFWINEIANFNARLPLATTSFDQLTKCRQFLLDAVKVDTPKAIRLDFLNDPKSFFETLRFGIAERQNIAVGSLELEFHFGTPEENDFIIEGLYIYNGSIELGILNLPDKDSRPSMPLNEVLFPYTTVPRKIAKFFMCPMLRRPVMDNVRESFELTDEDRDNWVLDMIIETKKGDRVWLLNSTAIYINVPDMFI